MGALSGAEEAFALGGGVFGVVGGEVAVVAGLDGAAVVRFDVVAVGDPRFAKRGEAGLDGAGVGGVAPGAGGVVDADGFVDFDLAAVGLGGAEGDLAHGDADVGMQLAFEVDAGAGGELVGAVGVGGLRRGDGVGGGVHGSLIRVNGQGRGCVG